MKLTVQLFENIPVRIVESESGLNFVASDVCAVLGLTNSRKACEQLDDDEKGVTLSDTLGGKQKTTVISESGLYHLIFKSRKPAAKRFRKWVTGEVLPTLRRSGVYVAGEGSGAAPGPVLDTGAAAAAGSREELEKKLESTARELAEARIAAEELRVWLGWAGELQRLRDGKRRPLLNERISADAAALLRARWGGNRQERQGLTRDGRSVVAAHILEDKGVLVAELLEGPVDSGPLGRLLVELAETEGRRALENGKGGE